MNQTFTSQIDDITNRNNVVDGHNSNEYVKHPSYEDLILSDLQEILFTGKTLNERYEMILRTCRNSYKGFDKSLTGVAGNKYYICSPY